VDLPEFQRRFADRVRVLRTERKLRQEDLEDFGLSWKSIQKLEYSATDPKVSTLLKLCRAFGMTLPELLNLDNTDRRRSSQHRQAPATRAPGRRARPGREASG
jgi:transcriptional regulator with XRE-family HTH domain